MRVRYIKIRQNERGLLFRDRELKGMLRPGRHLILDPFWKVRVDVVSVRQPWLEHADLDVIVRSGVLGDDAAVLDLAGHQRALVWIDGRFAAVCGPGLKVLWTVFHDVRVEILDARELRLDHDELPAILASPGAAALLQTVTVEAGHKGLVFVDGRLRDELGPGLYAYWRDMGRIQALVADLREKVLDISGQELMTRDKVTLRVNAVVTYRVSDPARALAFSGEPDQALYRQAQLVLREVIGGRELDALLGEREAVVAELDGLLRARTGGWGMEIVAMGIRDVILPGEMKELLNQVTEAKKAAEAALITRREETAAMRSQANTARIFESNPALMRLRELEVLEKVAATSQLTLVLGETGLSERLMKLL